MALPETKSIRRVGCTDDELCNLLNIDHTELSGIRNGDRRNKLINATAWLFEKHGDATGDLIAWLAGYSSESIIRREFGSTTAVKRTVFRYHPCDWNGRISFSDIDVRKRVRIPESINETVAEETGIHIGDGNLYRNGKSTSYKISGNLSEDYAYYGEYTSNLLRRIYGIEPNKQQNRNKNEYVLILKSKAISSFKNEVLGLPFGSKGRITIPDMIFKKDELLAACIRGICDTDFYINNVIRGSFSSKTLVAQLVKGMKRLGFNPQYFSYTQGIGQKYTTHAVVIPKREITMYWRMIGFNNVKHESKIRLGQEYGSCPTHTTTEERLRVLSGKLDFKELSGFSQKRKRSAREKIFTTTAETAADLNF